MTRTLRLRLTAIVTVIAMLMVAIPAQALATDVLGESIGLIEIPLAPSNMTISKEVAMFDSVIDNLWTAREKLYDNPAVVGAPYVPAGATCLEVYSVGNVVYVNYIMNNTYYYTTYYKNTGEVEKVARVKNSDDIYSVSTANTTASVVRNLDEWRSTYRYSKELETYVLVEESIAVQSMGGRSVNNAAYVNPYGIHDFLGAEYNPVMTSGYAYIYELLDYLNEEEEEEMVRYYEIQKESDVDLELSDYDTQDFAAYTPVSQIASAFCTSTFYIRSIVGAEGVSINSNDCIMQAVSIVSSGYQEFYADIIAIMDCPFNMCFYAFFSWFEFADFSEVPMGTFYLAWADASDTGLGYYEPKWSEVCELYFNASIDYIVEVAIDHYGWLVETQFINNDYGPGGDSAEYGE